MLSQHEVLLAGTLARDSETSVAGHGRQTTTAWLCVSEERDGQTYRNWIPVDACGKGAPILGKLGKGDACLVKGKLNRRPQRQPARPEARPVYGARHSPTPGGTGTLARVAGAHRPAQILLHLSP
jgi:hypothetical protein